MFSRRVPDNRAPTRLAQAVESARRRGPVLDLTLSNPTRAGLSYPVDILDTLADGAALTYYPEPFGLRTARDAVTATYARRGVRASSDRIVLTASTSDAYSLLFKLLCEPGRSSVLTPVPSYPLFDHLTRLDGVESRRYALEYHGNWSIAAGELDRAWSGDTRAVLAVSPNNPTGSIVRDPDAAELVHACACRDAALIVDEVFREYPLQAPLPEAAALDAPECLMFRLGGLSKSAGLPQVKLGWISVDGPAALVAEALDRLELICDTYLSVSTPAQVAAPALIEGGRDVRDRILDRIRGNYGALQARAAGAPGVTVLNADGGWSAVLRVPATAGEEQLALDLLERHAVVVHPGYFFDFAHEAYLVVSLLPDPSTFERGIDLVLESAHAT
jgi:aspartate/methionine/tyrosine aminotransferase